MDAKSCSRDAISWLPDEVLSKILSLLPTKEAASTALLSKKWRNVFRLVDNLGFDDSASGEDELTKYVFPESFKSFVDKTLALQRDYTIKKFSLKCHVGNQKARVERWILNVVERGVLEMDLRIIYQGIDLMSLQLFKSKTLVKLTLGRRLNLGKLPSDMSLPSLKTLFIHTVFFENDDFCGVLLAGCPVLEELSVHHSDFSGTPQQTISSPTVKRLSLDFGSSNDVYSWNTMSLDLPKLVYLDYSHCALAKYPQVNLESLVEAKLDLKPLTCVNWQDITKLLYGIRNVEILHLSPASVAVIFFFFSYELPMFNNLVKLSFGTNYKYCWRLLQSPKLETLIIQDLNGYTCDDVCMPMNKVKIAYFELSRN